MKYIVETEKTVEQAVEDLKQAVINNKFGILHVHDLKATLNKKGVDFVNECRIFEICNPEQANAVLANDMSLNMALPSAILSSLSDSEQLKTIAKEVESVINTIIDQAT